MKFSFLSDFFISFNVGEESSLTEDAEDLFEGDMKLSESQLLAMQKGSLGPFGDFEKVT